MGGVGGRGGRGGLTHAVLCYMLSSQGVGQPHRVYKLTMYLYRINPYICIGLTLGSPGETTNMRANPTCVIRGAKHTIQDTYMI